MIIIIKDFIIKYYDLGIFEFNVHTLRSGVSCHYQGLTEDKQVENEFP